MSTGLVRRPFGRFYALVSIRRRRDGGSHEPARRAPDPPLIPGRGAPPADTERVFSPGKAVVLALVIVALATAVFGFDLLGIFALGMLGLSVVTLFLVFFLGARGRPGKGSPLRRSSRSRPGHV